MEEANIHILQVLERKGPDTSYRVRCLRCESKVIMLHSTIRYRIAKQTRSCLECRSVEGVEKDTTPSYASDPDEIVPPMWPVPRMLRGIPRPWSEA